MRKVSVCFCAEGTEQCCFIRWATPSSLLLSNHSKNFPHEFLIVRLHCWVLNCALSTMLSRLEDGKKRIRSDIFPLSKFVLFLATAQNTLNSQQRLPSTLKLHLHDKMHFNVNEIFCTSLMRFTLRIRTCSAWETEETLCTWGLLLTPACLLQIGSGFRHWWEYLMLHKVTRSKSHSRVNYANYKLLCFCLFLFRAAEQARREIGWSMTA